MKKIIYTSFTSFFIMMSTSSFGKALRNAEITQMENGKPTEAALADIEKEVAKAETIAPARADEVALDPSKARTDTEVIAALSAREIFVVVDQSGSMTEKDDNPTGTTDSNWTRWKSAEVAVQGLMDTMLALDSDGEIPVYFFQGYERAGGKDNPKNVSSVVVKTSVQITQEFSKRTPGGKTPLGQVLETLRRDKLDSLLQKGEPFTVVILTDGAPDDENGGQARVDAFFKSLAADHNLAKPGRESLAAFTFVRQGDDADSAKFLQHLDDELGPTLGVDVIDTKEDNFIFGTQKGYTGQQGPVELLRQAVDD